MKAYIHPASPNCIAVLAAAHEAGIELATEFVDLAARASRHAGRAAGLLYQRAISGKSLTGSPKRPADGRLSRTRMISTP